MNLLTEGIIAEKVRKGELSASALLYHTCRDVQGKSGKKGSIRVLVLKTDNIARTEYICPECGHHGYIELEWKRPFSVKCEKCNATIRVPRLKDLVKRDK